jgi:hypothetical protein
MYTISSDGKHETFTFRDAFDPEHGGSMVFD